MTTRFQIYREIGQGSFSKLYEAYDYKYQMYVALKVEKEDKLKRILRTEFEILKALQGVQHIPKVIEFVDNYNPCKPSQNLNCIEMELLGKNISNFKKTFLQFNSILACDILLQALKAIENLHNKRYIHRDIKPTNFVLGKEDEKRLNYNYSRGLHINDIRLYMVDFGLAKIHLDENLNPQPSRQNAEFRGTLTYASLNAHYKTDLSRRDDLWSFFFMILDLLNENLPWRNCKDDKEEIKTMKEKCLSNPEANLFLTTTKGKKELYAIFEHLYSLSYQSKPDYNFIHEMLFKLKMNEINIIAYRNFEYYYNQWNTINPIQQQLATLTYQTNPFIHQDSNYPIAFNNTHEQSRPQPIQNFYTMALGDQRQQTINNANLSNSNNLNIPMEYADNINMIYDSFLNKKTHRSCNEDENFNNIPQPSLPSYSSPIVKNTPSNNVTINNPTQNQIVIINQYQEEGLSKRILDYILDHMDVKSNNNNNHNISNKLPTNNTNDINFNINDLMKEKMNNPNNLDNDFNDYKQSQAKMSQSSHVYYSFNEFQNQQQQQSNFIHNKRDPLRSSCPRPAASSFVNNYIPPSLSTQSLFKSTKPDINDDKLLIDSIIQKLPQNSNSTSKHCEKNTSKSRKNKPFKESRNNQKDDKNDKGEIKMKNIFIINKKA